MTGATHPFFGNQYTDGGYIAGTFKYSDKLAREVGERIMALSVSDGASKSISSSIAVDSIEKVDVKNKWIIGGFIVVGVAVGAYFAYRYIKKKNTVIIPNVGVCEKCGEPLTESELIADENNLFIACKNCGEKNYAHYYDEDYLTNPSNDKGLIIPSSDENMKE